MINEQREAYEAWLRVRDVARVSMKDVRKRVKERIGKPIFDIREHVKGIGMHAVD